MGTRFVPMSDRMKIMLRAWCESRKEGWAFPSSRSKSGHLITIAKGFQAARGRAGDEKLVPYSARHTYGTYTMEKSDNAFAVSKSMGTPTSNRWSRISTRNWNPCGLQSISTTGEKVWSGFGKRIVGSKRLVLVSTWKIGGRVVDAVGIEPTTSRLRVECSTN